MGVSESDEAARAFHDALAPAHRPPSPDDVAPAVAAAWRAARDAHPTLSIGDIALMTFAGSRIRTADPAAELGRRHVADLYLACACAAGDPAALAVLERRTLPAVERALGGLARDADARRDLVQQLRTQMLVPMDGKPPGIAAYDGRAPLATWLRVCATRLGMRRAARDRRDASLEDLQLDQLAPDVPDPALAYMRQHYGAQFRVAFGEAVSALAPRQRNLMRHSVIDGLGIDQIAAIYHVHRATAARQLKDARDTLIAATRERLRSALGIGEAELDSVFRVLVSLTDVTLREVLGPRRSARESE
jgi:RNA polymerase sigma-70 factor (ECF subfamily)